MPTARKLQVNLTNTPYYHCISRCVRRAFLCGQDAYSGQSYEHRRQWVETRIHLLAQVFTIDICAYAVMSNHVHVVLHVDQQQALSLTDNEVIERWHLQHKGTLLTHAFIKGDTLSPEALECVTDTVCVWRKRLCSISWFMRSLNEYIARKANQEDNCTGRFWEGRFKSQALLGEKALAACMAYVDLNPIRAHIADKPETSDHTSIQYRINATRVGKTPKYLMPFKDTPHADNKTYLPFALHDYLSLVDDTGRNMRRSKNRLNDTSLPDMLTSLSMNTSQWQELTDTFEQCFAYFAGSVIQMQQYQQTTGLKRLRHKAAAKRLFD